MRESALQGLVLAGLLHDIGKFMQRAHKEADLARLAPESARAEGTYCPVLPDGRYSHRHVLWTDAFFDWLLQNVGAPPDMDLGLAQKIAVSHHRPEAAGDLEALAWCIAEGDRLSAGMDRRQAEEGVRGHRARSQPLRSPLAAVNLGRGEVPMGHHRLTELSADAGRLYPVQHVAEVSGDMPEQYAALWAGFTAGALALRNAATARHFTEGTQGLLERFTWAVPSSTVDLPDISLYDHVHTTAAFAVGLWAYHRERGVPSPARIRDREAPAFRIVVGDLSGIQRTLFTLATQGARGVAKILRARSFLLGAIVDAVALMTLERLGLPWVCRVQSAGGRFLVLAPNNGGVEERVKALGAEVNRWLATRYLGELGFNLGLTPALAPAQFVDGRFHEVLDAVAVAVDDAKARPLRGVAPGPLEVTYPEGVCPVCDRRPKEPGYGDRCGPCAEEARVGRILPRLRYLVYGPAAELRREGLEPVGLPGGKGLAVVTGALPPRPPSGWRIEAADPEASPAFPHRFVARYVPVWEEGEWDDPRYSLAEEGDPDERPHAGAIKTFAHLACEAREPSEKGFRGRALLALLKADVDYLGFVFAAGIPRDRQSLSRYAGLSRTLDFFFSAHLPWIIASDREFRCTYTVYAGGDDLLLVGPWRQMVALAGNLAEAFRAYVGGNPNLTLSAAVVPMAPNASLTRAAAEADHALDRAKQAGRDRLWLFGHIFRWEEFPRARETAETLVSWVKRGDMTRGLVYRLLQYSRMRKEVEQRPEKAVWRARLAYDLKRNVKDRTAMAGVLSLVGLDPDLRPRGDSLEMLPAAVQWALYRLRS